MPTETITALGDRALETVRQSQDAVVSLVATWAKTAGSLLPARATLPFADRIPGMPFADQIPGIVDLVRNTFDFLDRLLASQKDFVTAVFAAVSPRGVDQIGVDQNRDTLEGARRQMPRPGGGRVELISEPLGDAPIPVVADAAMFCFTHDVLRSRPALERILSRARPGGRVAAVGFMWAPRWAPALNLLIWNATEGYVTTYEGFSAPWSHLAALVPDLAVERHDLRGHFFASGALPAAKRLCPGRAGHRAPLPGPALVLATSRVLITGRSRVTATPSRNSASISSGSITSTENRLRSLGRERPG